MKFQFPVGLLLWLLTGSVLAHPGGLDANGGHTDKKTGEYHYHKKSGADSTPASSATQKAATPKSTATSTAEPAKTTAPVPATSAKPKAEPLKPASTTAAEPHDFARLVGSLIDPVKLATLGPREANPRVQQAVALLKQADLAGLRVTDVVSNAIAFAGYTNASLAAMTHAALAHNVEVATGFGVLTTEGLGLMQSGQPPVIQTGSFSGDTLTVGQIVPLAVAPELGNVIANLEFLPLKVATARGDAMGDKQREAARHFREVGLLSDARLREILRQ